LHGVSVDIADSEFVVLVGPSGCGKSTLLRMIAGLENISVGEIAIGKRVVNTLPPKDRDVAMVFQNYALYPHMTVFDNMAFSLKLANAPAPVMEREVQRAAPGGSCRCVPRPNRTASSTAICRTTRPGWRMAVSCRRCRSASTASR
jgi:predicted ABC-type transport system involved in lysophospholipase L1 biosynthesis ATPase subunit